jgi:hypothetical protein
MNKNHHNLPIEVPDKSEVAFAMSVSSSCCLSLLFCSTSSISLPYSSGSMSPAAAFCRALAASLAAIAAFRVPFFFGAATGGGVGASSSGEEASQSSYNMLSDSISTSLNLQSEVGMIHTTTSSSSSSPSNLRFGIAAAGIADLGAVTCCSSSDSSSGRSRFTIEDYPRSKPYVSEMIIPQAIISILLFTG